MQYTCVNDTTAFHLSYSLRALYKTCGRKHQPTRHRVDKAEVEHIRPSMIQWYPATMAIHAASNHYLFIALAYQQSGNYGRFTQDLHTFETIHVLCDPHLGKVIHGDEQSRIVWLIMRSKIQDGKHGMQENIVRFSKRL